MTNTPDQAASKREKVVRSELDQRILNQSLEIIRLAIVLEDCTCNENDWPYNCDRCADLNRLRPIKDRIGSREKL